MKRFKPEQWPPQDKEREADDYYQNRRVTSEVKDQAKDLMTDIRCAYRDNLQNYAMECELELFHLVSCTKPVMDKYGYYH